MEIEFITDDNARKMLHVYHAFSHMPYGLVSAPMVFGGEFYNAYRLYRLIINDEGAPNEMFEEIASNETKIRPGSNKQDLLIALNKVKFQLRPKTDPFFKAIGKGISAELKKREAKVGTYLKDVFGFSMPKRLVVILAENLKPHASSGYGIRSRQKDKCMAAFVVGETAIKNLKQPSAVIIHEMLHSLLSSSKTIKDSSGDMFMESLFDYFVPEGMISARLGLVKTRSIEGYFSKNAQQRPEAKEMSTKLLPSMKEYEKIFGKETIWRFLSKKGFGTYINKSRR